MKKARGSVNQLCIFHQYPEHLSGNPVCYCVVYSDVMIAVKRNELHNPVRLNKETLSILTDLLTMTGATYIFLNCPFNNLLEVS